MAVHPASHNWPVDNKLADVIPSKIRATLAVAGSCGIFNVACFLEITLLPLGQRALMYVAGAVWESGCFIKYVPVAPVSGWHLIVSGLWWAIDILDLTMLA